MLFPAAGLQIELPKLDEQSTPFLPSDRKSKRRVSAFPGSKMIDWRAQVNVQCSYHCPQNSAQDTC